CAKSGNKGVKGVHTQGFCPQPLTHPFFTGLHTTHIKLPLLKLESSHPHPPPGPWPFQDPLTPPIHPTRHNMWFQKMKWISRTHPTRLPGRPSINPPSSVFLTFLEGIIGNPNNVLADGTVKIDVNLLGIIQQMMDAEATRLSKLEEHVEKLESFKARISALEGSRQPFHTSEIPAGTWKYARVTVPAPKPTPPKIQPPPKELSLNLTVLLPACWLLFA
ncbi:uncharacterized protein VP01_4579g1, partial [Puccinia sorghi]